MYSGTNKQKIGILTNERLVNHHFLTITNCKTSSGSNPNYKTAIFTSTIKEKRKVDSNCILSNECARVQVINSEWALDLKKIKKTDRPVPKPCSRQTRRQVKWAQSRHSYCPSLLQIDLKASAKTVRRKGTC